MVDALLSDDLATFLSVFPQNALEEIVDVLKKNKSPTPFPMPAAKNARKAGAGEKLADHAEEIASEILWWGSNEITRQIGKTPAWRDLLISVGVGLDVRPVDLRLELPIYQVEGAIMQKAIPDWAKLNPGERARKIREAGVSSQSALGLLGTIPTIAINLAARFGFAAAGAEVAGAAAGAAAGGTAAAGTGIVAAISPFLAAAAPILAAAAAVIGTGYTIFELSGPAHRVIRPVVLLVAYSRQRLRDKRNANSFEV